jgi:serine/threonine protein phosphatase PrpC
MSIKVFQLHKPESSAFKEIQDRLNISKDRKVIALADGTTQGHQSELWAQHLVDEFVNNPVFTLKGFTKFIAKISENFNKQSKPDNNENTSKSVEWLIKQKKEEGSSAAFLALSLEKNNSYKAICYGDSRLFLIKDGKLKDTFPSKQRNTFINTDFKHFKVENIFTKTGKIIDGDRLLLVSDSIGDYFQKNVRVNSKKLCSLSSFEEFKIFVESSFESNKMEMDDITIINIHLDSDNNIDIYKPPKKFKYKSSLLPSPKPKISTRGVRIAKGGVEMKQLIDMLQTNKEDLTREIGEYKIIAARLIRMNFIQWIIMSLMILYMASTGLSKTFSYIKQRFAATNKEVAEQTVQPKETAKEIETGPQLLQDYLKSVDKLDTLNRHEISSDTSSGN